MVVAKIRLSDWCSILEQAGIDTKGETDLRKLRQFVTELEAFTNSDPDYVFEPPRLDEKVSEIINAVFDDEETGSCIVKNMRIYPDREEEPKSEKKPAKKKKAKSKSADEALVPPKKEKTAKKEKEPAKMGRPVKKPGPIKKKNRFACAAEALLGNSNPKTLDELAIAADKVAVASGCRSNIVEATRAADKAMKTLDAIGVIIYSFSRKHGYTIALTPLGKELKK